MPKRLAWAVLRWLPAKSVLPVSTERKTSAMIGEDIHTGVIWLYHQRPDFWSGRQHSIRNSEADDRELSASSSSSRTHHLKRGRR